jgi:fructokinase
MNKVVCFGEALIDFLNFDSVTSGPLKLNNYCQYPGGAPANASVAVAKLGGDACFLGQVGNDAFGDFLAHALHAYGVNVEHLVKHPTAKTALAFVMLDDAGERSFSFYRDNSADVIFKASQLPKDLFNRNDFLHICSNTLTEQNISETTQAAIDIAKKQGAVISFDVNLRHNLWAQGQADIQLVNQFVKQADVLKFSKDELTYLAGGNCVGGDDKEQQYIQKLIAGGCELLVVTNDGEPIHYFTQLQQGVFTPPKVDVVDTTAGGDAFSGGLLFQLSRTTDWRALLQNEVQLQQLVAFATACGAYTVARAGAFPALPSFSDIKNLSITGAN